VAPNATGSTIGVRKRFRTAASRVARKGRGGRFDEPVI
jgi:hypothetical protein